MNRGQCPACATTALRARQLIVMALLLVIRAEIAHAEPVVSNASLILNAAQVDVPNTPTTDSWGIANTTGIWFSPSHVNLELNFACGDASNPNFHAQQGSAGANLIWSESTWRVGASTSRHLMDRSGPDPRATNCGLYGVWFPSGSLTLQGKGGRFSGNTDGKYAGIAANWYVTPNVSLFGARDSADYDQDFEESISTGSVQYLPREGRPLSFVLGYSRTDFDFSNGVQTHANALFVAVRFFFNRSGQRTLVGRERTGPVGWPGSFNFQGIGF